MLVELRIRNVAVIESVTLPFRGGLNVLTGETGAGKSLIVGALGLLLGERAAADRIRAGTERATVEGTFDIAKLPVLRRMLEERGIEVDEDLIVLKRELTSAGRSRAWINGTTVTAGMLAETGAQLVSVHGQHESRLLLDAAMQRDVLDAFANAIELRNLVKVAHERVATLREREHAIDETLRETQRRADYLRFVVSEVDGAKLQAGEDESIEADIHRLSHAEELQATALQTAAALGGDEHSVSSLLARVRRQLAAISRIDADAERWLNALETAMVSLQELAREVEDYGTAVAADPDRLRQLEARRELINGLLRKYGATIEEVLAFAQASRDQLAALDTGATDKRQLAADREQAERDLRESAARLTQARTAGATQLADAVTVLLPQLGLPDGRFGIVLTPSDEIRESGAEQVSFTVALNGGDDQRPLDRIASGGELSRLMLALSTVLVQLQHVPTLVFDEVDAGIGGAVAWQVGALMQRVANHHQVLSISHLAQIAARADHHLVVRKGAVGTVTTADTEVVTDEERTVEIARMLGGDADREVSRAHARELLERGQRDAHDGANSDDAASNADARAIPVRSRQRRGKPV